MFVIDTNSLLNLVRYYLPFDKDSTLVNFIKKKVESNEIIVIDKVFDQCIYIAKGIVVERLSFLKKNQKSTSECLPDNSMFHHINHSFVNQVAKKLLKEEDIESQTTNFLEDADLKLILFSLKHTNFIVQPVIVTEETGTANDNKLYKKIPAMCKQLKLETINLPELLKRFDGFNWHFKLTS